jgi:F0F1-type ATP synthase assembly protein I
LSPTPKDNKPTRRPSDTAGQLLRFADMAFRMGVIIAIGAFAGYWLDKKMNLTTPIFTIVLSLIAIGGAMYMVIKAVSKSK